MNANPILHKEYADNRLVLQLFGAHHGHLARIEQALDVAIHARGNQLTISGGADGVAAAGQILDRLGDGEIGFTGARRAEAEDEVVLVDRFDVGRLRRRTRLDGALTDVDGRAACATR
jgi:phosphate starvation-inducible protein PhoH